MDQRAPPSLYSFPPSPKCTTRHDGLTHHEGVIRPFQQGSTTCASAPGESVLTETPRETTNPARKASSWETPSMKTGSAFIYTSRANGLHLPPFGPTGASLQDVGPGFVSCALWPLALEIFARLGGMLLSVQSGAGSKAFIACGALSLTYV